MNYMIEAVHEHLPQFNKDLLVNFRQRKMDEIAEYLHDHFRQIIQLFDGIEYAGYKVLTPVEAVRWRLNHSNAKNKVSINKTSQKVVNYRFKMDDTYFDMYLQLPYIHQPEGCVYLNDTQHYPMFILVEKVIRSFREHVSMKAAIIAMVFHRQDECTLVDTRGRADREFVITAKIHYGDKVRETPPIVLYHLVEHGWDNTMRLYDINPKDMQIVDCDNQEQGYRYFKITQERYIRVNEQILTDFRKMRVLVGIYRIFKHWKRFKLSDVYSPSCTLYKIILGKYTNKTTVDQNALYKYAETHLKIYNIMLDKTLKSNLAKAGYPCNNMSDLLLHVFNNIDSWLMSEPNNLYTKRLCAVEAMVSQFIFNLSKEQFNIVSPRNPKIDHNVIKKFVNRMSTTNPSWFKGMCRSNPTVVNGNWLVTIGLKMERKFNSGGSTKASYSTPAEMLISHPSWLAVESNVCLPSSNPIMSGTINPYLQVDEDGDVIVPPWADEIAHVFN